ncbi:MAG: GtrA family protein [Paracoccaceae bacterium]|nr:GtrA family protein [Paracoccaceae bacterium]
MNQFSRYVCNGLFATAIHYAVLTFNLDVIAMTSVGWANFFAAIVGITASFLGSKFFVFAGCIGKLEHQAARFVLVYGAIAVMHGLILHVWSDQAGLPHTWGFLVATIVQVAMSYFANKFYVFSK